jgi:signal transduction histidine kinase/CheY-like chemotaxis protein
MKPFFFLLFSLCIGVNTAFTQNSHSSAISNLERDILYAQHDTIKIKLLIELVDSIYDEQIWPRYNEEAYEIGLKLSVDNNPRIQLIGKTYLADAISNHGYLKDNRGDYKGAFLDYFEALKIREHIGYQRGIASSYNNIGQVFQKQNDLNRALDYFQKSYEIRVQNGDENGMAQSLNHLGEINKIQKNYDIALNYMLQSLTVYRKIAFKSGEAEVLRDISETYLLQGRYNLAQEHIKESILHFYEIKSPRGFIEASILLAKIKMEQRLYSEAIDITKKQLPIAEKNQFLESKVAINELLSQAYEAKGNTQMAYQYFKKFIILRDSLTNPKTKNNILEQQLQYEYGKKDAEHIAEQYRKDAQSQNIRNTLIASCLVLFLIAGILINRNYIRLKANEELAEKNKIIEQEKQRAEESERFKSQFLSNISHEIRTPMNAILGMSDLLSLTTIDSQQAKYISAIKKSSENLLLIINDVLDFSKLEAEKVELERVPFKPSDVLNDVFNTLKFKAEEKGLDFKVKIDPDTSPVLLGDNFRLYQILMNLAGNAIKFTEKGCITIETEVLYQDETIQTIRYLVRDTGMGIDPEKISSIFDSFQQAETDTSRRFGGTGLGLSIAQRLVKLRNSEIKVESELGKGSVFYFDIINSIASEEDFIKFDLKNNQIETADFKDIKILLAEDNEYNQIVAVESLMRHLKHCEVQVANNGKEVLTLLQRNDYDVILMDLNMPEMNGLEATKIIRTTFEGKKANIPIIALTAFAFEEENKSMDAGMNAYITKPFKINHLLNIIAKLLDNHNVENIDYHSSETIVSNDLLDLTFINDFTENDAEQISYFIEKFIKNTPKEMLSIETALQSNDFEKIRRAAHTFKPQIEFVGIKKAAFHVLKLEEDAANQQIIPILYHHFEELQQALEEGINELKKYC